MDTRRLITLLLAVATLPEVHGQECSSNNMSRCKRDAEQLLNNPDHSNTDRYCKSLRQQFDCVIWQTSMCLEKSEQEDNRDTISKLWRYLQSMCEQQGNWYTKSCFQRDDVRRCEALLPARGYSTDMTSCRSFGSFRDCVTSIVLLDCSSSDQALLGTYLMEKGQQRAWNCPRSSYNSVSIPTNNDRFAAIAASSYAGECVDASRYALEECSNQFDEQEQEARERNDSDMKHHKTCCALLGYESCVSRILEKRCEESRARTETRALAAMLRQRFPYHSCEDHTETECSGSGHMAALQNLYVLLPLLIFTLTSKMSKGL